MNNFGFKCTCTVGVFTKLHYYVESLLLVFLICVNFGSGTVYGLLLHVSTNKYSSRKKITLGHVVLYDLFYFLFFYFILQPVENCVCTLHNLTFKLWHECPEASFSTEAQSGGRKSPIVGCFSPRSGKAKDEVGVHQEA